jgi:rod shape determining protein RodA
MTSFLRSRQMRDADHVMISAMVGIAVFGMLTLRSIPGADFHRQTLLFVVGVLFFLAAASIDYGWLRHSWQPLYWVTLSVLVVVLVFGRVVLGGRSFIAVGPIQVQPSEFAKVVLMVCLAVYASEAGSQIRDPLELSFSFVSLVLPVFGLILAQRDLGTALVILSIWLGVMYFAGANLWHLAAFIVGCMVVAKLGWDHGLVPQYRIYRILAWLHPRDFLDPQADYGMPGMQYLQAWRAIGSGGIWGQGYGRGQLTQFGRVPEQATDMTFSALGEELGFVGCIIIVILYGIVIWRGVNTIAQTQHDLGRYIAAGVISYLAFEVLVSIGMNVGLLPITGIPLPLFSRGGSNLLSTMIAMGLLVNVHLRRRRITFEAAT